MVWHIRGKRILSDSEASREDAGGGLFDHDMIAMPPATFVLTFPTIWWASGDAGFALVLSFFLSISTIIFPFVAALSSVWFCGFLVWVILPAYWDWGAISLLAVWGFYTGWFDL